MINKLYLIDLCEYTLNQSFSDNGKYYPFQTAQDILDEIK